MRTRLCAGSGTGNARADVLDDGKVVRDEQGGQAELLPESFDPLRASAPRLKADTRLDLLTTVERLIRASGDGVEQAAV